MFTKNAQSNGSSKHSVSDLMRRQAEWSRQTADWRSAAQMYADAGEYIKAIELLCENHGVEPLMDIVHKLKKTDEKELRMCAKYFAENGHHNFAKQVYLKMDAIEELLRLHMRMHKWEDALALAERPEYRGRFDDIVFLPYAQYLAGADRFDEAQAAFKRAGRPEESLKLLTAHSLTAPQQNDASRLPQATTNSLDRRTLGLRERLDKQIATVPRQHRQVLSTPT